MRRQPLPGNMLSHSPTIDTRTSVVLDGIRGGSALVVLIAHLNQIIMSPRLETGGPAVVALGILASYAVMVFFVISGFMISASIAGNLKRHDGRFSERRFMSDRFYRLYPPLLFSLLICFLSALVAGCFHFNVIAPLSGEHEMARDSIQFARVEAVSVTFFMQGLRSIPMVMNGPLWSLGFEFWFYVLAMLVMSWTVNRRVISGCLVALLGLALYWEGMTAFISFLLIWCTGAAWYVYRSKAMQLAWTQGIIIPVLLGLVSFMGVLVYRYGCAVMVPTYSGSSFHFQLAFCWCLCVALAFVLRQPSEQVPAWPIRLLSKAAPFSYTLYIIHFPLALLAFAAMHPWLNAQPLLVSLGICAGLFCALTAFSMGAGTYLEDRHLWRSLVDGILQCMVTAYGRLSSRWRR